MPPSAIIPDLDVLKGGQPGFGPCLEINMVDQLTFERLEKTFRYRVVPAVAFPTAPAARSYSVPQASSSIDRGTPCRHTARPDPNETVVVPV